MLKNNIRRLQARRLRLQAPPVIDTLPYLLQWYEKVKEEEPNFLESINRSRLLNVETAIVRVTEGTYWQVDD
jgi:hypothetical protein